MSIHLFGIRHHGPGSAASLLEALGDLQPDMVLLEGPPDGDPVADLALHPDMKPPVALLIYPVGPSPLKGGERLPPPPLEGGGPTEDIPPSSLGAYYPFADFSPEWNALRFALRQGIPVRFMDLPQAHQMAMDLERDVGVDALGELAQAAGYEDGERWWESLVEQRRGAQVFTAIAEAMAELRQGPPPQGREALREAWMRRTIRQAQKEGHQRIAVVCGAWHTPALDPRRWPSASHDDQLLKGLPKRKVEATWIPWTYDRLSFAQGYGAGVESPEYYHMLWDVLAGGGDVAVRWMVAAAQLLRAEDLPASPASAVEAVRLAHALAVLRGQPLAGLAELEEAARSVYCMGAETPLQLIRRKLVLGERLGSVPAEVPQVPLARDVAALQKRLRLPPEASHRDVDLDLRKPNDRERSQLLHRLNLLQIPWGKLGEARGTGTFRESWRLQWQPEFALELVQAAQWGSTVWEAATAFTAHQAEQCPDLTSLTALTEQVLLADLPQALAEVLAQLQERAALASDPAHLLEALPPFARILRYPDVRQTDAGMLTQVVGGMLERIAIGLPLACASLDDDAAEAMVKHFQPAQAALLALDNQDWLGLWRTTLATLADLVSLHGLVAGRAVWLLLDVGHLEPEQASRRLGLALSRATKADQAAAWVEGFLRDNGELLVHARELFAVLDDWVSQLSDERFIEVLPLLRRTFATFSPSVRHHLGQALRRDRAPTLASNSDIDEERALLVVPLLRQILGVSV